MTNETIADIIAEVREYLTSVGPGESVDEDFVAGVCDRIEAAANELKKQSDDYRILYSVALTDIAHLHDKLKTAESKAHIGYEAIKEVERLRAALKPILECECFDVYAWMGDQLDAEQRVAVDDAINAIREAQEIMKGESNDQR